MLAAVLLAAVGGGAPVLVRASACRFLLYTFTSVGTAFFRRASRCVPHMLGWEMAPTGSGNVTEQLPWVKVKFWRVGRADWGAPDDVALWKAHWNSAVSLHRWQDFGRLANVRSTSDTMGNGVSR